MSGYFTIDEMTRSETADRLGIDNTPPDEVKTELERTMALLDRIRSAWKRPIRVTSGYRSYELNKAVKGKSTSQHLLGQAADIVPYNKDTLGLFNLIKGMVERGELSVGQLIWEGGDKRPRWIHVSTPTRRHLNEVLYIR